MACEAFLLSHMGGYFQGFEFLWLGKLRQFCGFILLWHLGCT